MAEAQRFGKPVIAYNRGGAKEIVIPGVTGELFEKQTVASLVATLEKFDPMRYNEKEIYANGVKFGTVVFQKKLKDQIQALVKIHTL